MLTPQSSIFYENYENLANVPYTIHLDRKRNSNSCVIAKKQDDQRYDCTSLLKRDRLLTIPEMFENQTKPGRQIILLIVETGKRENIRTRRGRQISFILFSKSIFLLEIHCNQEQHK